MESPDFEPVSEVAGNIEIILNKTSPEFDSFEPMSKQIIFSIGKTGRSNRMNFDEINSNHIEELIDALESVKDSLEDIEKFEKRLEQDNNFSIDSKESGTEALNTKDIEILTNLIQEKAYTEPIDKQKFIEQQEHEEGEVKSSFNNLMNEGKLFYPQKGKVKLNPTKNRIRLVKNIIEGLQQEEDSAEIKEVVNTATQADLDSEKVKEVIEKLKREGEMFEPDEGYIQII